MQSNKMYPFIMVIFFSAENLRDSRAEYKKLRDLGPLVWAPDLDLYIVARYDDVKAGLRASKQLISGEGVIANPVTNGSAKIQISTIISDGKDHLRRKQVLMRPLSPGSIKSLRERLAEIADEQIARLCDGEVFEAMREIASLLPLKVISELVGIRGFDNDTMLEWSHAMFDDFIQAEADASGNRVTVALEFVKFLMSHKREDLVPGGWADSLFVAAENGDITQAEAEGLMGDYIIPSLDTTIYSLGRMLHGLATSPGAWDKVVADPSLSKSIVLESVRMCTALRGFTRFAVEDYAIGDAVVPKGSRVWFINASANYDERKFPNPSVFDVERNPQEQLAWGHGVHLCVGKHLAQLEMETILSTLLKHVKSLELAGEPKRLVSQMAQGFSELPMRMYPK